MLFVDFNNLKIIKDFNYHTEEYSLMYNAGGSLTETSQQIKTLLERVIKHEALATYYIIHFEDDVEWNEEETENNFIGVVNTTLMNFFKIMTDPQKRQREYRLDVPDKLKGLHMSYSLLKKAINQNNINDIFNITITYKDLVYILCDEKDFKDEKIFIHTVDELESKHE